MIMIISCCWLYHDITFKCILGYTIIYDDINYIYIYVTYVYITVTSWGSYWDFFMDMGNDELNNFSTYSRRVVQCRHSGGT